MVQLSLKVIENILAQLHEKSSPKFGQMTPQEMVEHLEDTFNISMGKRDVEVYTPSHKLTKWKEFLMSDLPLPPYKSPIHKNGLPPLNYSNLDDAKQQLFSTLDEYNFFQKKYPETITKNPNFGNLNFVEWNKFHQKHLMHHFQQFQIIQ